MADIVLTTLNAKFIHAAFGLRYLLANLGELKPRARLTEFDINQRPLDIAEVLLAQNPKIIGFGIYIWNVEQRPKSSPPSKASGRKSKSFSAVRRSVTKPRSNRLSSLPTTSSPARPI